MYYKDIVFFKKLRTFLINILLDHDTPFKPNQQWT